MTPENFAFWLQGLFELAQPKSLDEKQTELVRQHLQLVFEHVVDDSDGAQDQQAIKPKEIDHERIRKLLGASRRSGESVRYC